MEAVLPNLGDRLPAVVLRRRTALVSSVFYLDRGYQKLADWRNLMSFGFGVVFIVGSVFLVEQLDIEFVVLAELLNRQLQLILPFDEKYNSYTLLKPFGP